MKNTKITIRTRKVKNGKRSIYLDYAPPVPNPDTGRNMRFEGLRLYIWEEPKTRLQHKENRQVMQLADEIRLRRLNEVNRSNLLTDFEKELQAKRKRLSKSFLDYYDRLAGKKIGQNYQGWRSAKKHLVAFHGKKDIRFADITRRFCESYRDYLLDHPTLAQNSAANYFAKFRNAIGEAYKDDLLDTNFKAKVPAISHVNPTRETLSVEEVNRLIKTPCESEPYKKAAIFMAMTGIRFGDLEGVKEPYKEPMKWKHLRHSEESGYYLYFTINKSKKPVAHPISEQAVEWLGEPQEPDTPLIPDLEYTGWNNEKLKRWVLQAGITNKEITLHNFRHTYATLLIAKGVPTEVIQRQLGHRDLRTTQIYAKTTDQQQRQAADTLRFEIG